MSILDFRPAPGAAPLTRRVLAHAATETRLLVRNGEQLLLALVIPIGILVAGRVVGGRFGEMAVLAPSVLALAVWSSAFTSVAIATGFERRYGVLERVAATPLGRSGLLAGKALSIGTVIVAQLAVLGGAAVLAGWRPQLTGLSLFVALVALVLAVGVFACLALTLAGSLRAEITLALANLVYVVLVVCGGLVIPLSRYPEAVQGVVRLLPTAALGEALRSALVGLSLGWPLAVLGCWLALAALAAWKGFRWMS